ncbi:MAG: B12-binding domain-containing radical SAM protein [Desulfitobacteriaceae bacterium]|nr:B12-binding domain-containing radical SAM protein [Desulfitobacteriaceae bacterium]MDI6879846.1 B12-binding domain-containing radical SAM protein [Desulfitobacteriaceae bacterium]MDI6915296.1 B12-binding domain-containing radical SAM protein [Desulfitobacteriaceae bacterium]
MKILLLYPQYPITYWGFQYALKFVSKKAGFPPLGLLTVAALLPAHYEKKLIDLNVTTLKDKDLLWADYVFVSAMVVQKESAREVINRCKKLGVKTVAGGPLFTSEYEEFDDVDHLLLNEGELSVPTFVSDIENGTTAHLYTSEKWADLRTTPVPLWNLINTKKYATMNIQYSRGCPFNCEFCNITSLYGHIPRTKDVSQLLEELDAIYNSGWREAIFFVDDNFIGNKRKLTEEILPALIEWMAQRKYPFTFLTEASINLSDDEKLMKLMVKAGFNTVFIGIETPNEDSLVECNKIQNKNRDLISCVKKIQRFGLQVQGGFIVGFDNDTASIFDSLISFIQESGIVTAMVGLLNAPKGTKLYQRLAGEGRLIEDFSGDNTNFTMNFMPKMDSGMLVNGYKRIVDTIYSPKKYYERVLTFLKEYNPTKAETVPVNLSNIKAFFKSIIRLGIIGKERRYYWKLIFWSLFKRPKVFPLAVTLSIYGFHFRKVFKRTVLQP